MSLGSWALRVLVAATAIAAGACSAVQEVWLKPGYNAKAPNAVKRIAILAEPAPQHPGLAELLSQVAADRIKLKMSYLVYDAGLVESDWQKACPATTEASTGAPSEDPAAPPPIEGVLVLRPLHVNLGAEVELHLVGELYACGAGELLWRAVGVEGNAAENEDLAALTQGYIQNLGERVQPFAAPAFLVLRDMLDQLPDVVLTDEEIMEKIELSAAPPAPSSLLASRAP